MSAWAPPATSAARPRLRGRSSATWASSRRDDHRDMKFTLETVNCVGACALGPMVVVDGEYHGQMTAAQGWIALLKKLRMVEELSSVASDGSQPVPKIKIAAANWTALRQIAHRRTTTPSGPSSRSAAARAAAYGCCEVHEPHSKTSCKKHGLQGQAEVKATGCHGFCERGPLVVLQPEEHLLPAGQVEDVPEIVETTVVEGQIIERLLYTDPQTGQNDHRTRTTSPSTKQQTPLVLGNNGMIDPHRHRGLHRRGRLLRPGQGADT